MSRNRKLIIVVIVSFGLICWGSAMFYPFILSYIIAHSTGDITKVRFEKYDEVIFFKSINRGIDSKIRAVSTSNDFEFDETTEYVFRSDLDIFYKVKDDTLLLFVLDSAATPKNFTSKVIVKQVLLENPAYNELYVTKDAEIKVF